MDNEQVLMQKADMALSDLSTAGLLSPTQSDTFFRTLIDEPTLLNSIRTKVMAAPVDKINRIGFGSRIMRPAVASTALSSGDRSKPDLSQITLTTTEYMAEVRLPYAVLEDNIEGGNITAGPTSSAGGIHNTIVQLIAQRAALDFEDLAINGDIASGDAYLATQNGFLKKATANVVNVGAAFDKAAAKAALKATPTRFLRNRTLMRHFVSVNSETELRDSYGSRQTALGDATVQGNAPLNVFGSGVTGVALMPGANGLFTNPQNMIMGIWRNVTIEYDKDIRTREFIIVLTTRLTFEYEEPAAVTKYIGIVGG